MEQGLDSFLREAHAYDGQSMLSANTSDRCESLNVHALARGCLSSVLGTDQDEMRKMVRRSTQIRFSVKYERRRTISSFQRRD